MPESREQYADNPFEAPGDPLESQVAKILAEVLDVDRIGRSDSFYDFGGTSLQAIRICARVERDIGCKALPVWLFEYDVLADFVQRLDRAAATAPEPASRPQARHQLSFAQQRLWLADQLAPGSTDYNAFELHRLIGDLDLPALRGALADTIARHETLRTTFYAEDGVPYQRIADNLEVPIEVITATDAQVQAAVEGQTRKPFQLEHGPLIRLTLLRVDPAHHLMLLVAHHIIIDDWSLAVFWRDLCAYYQARTGGLPAELKPLALQYAGYATRQRTSLQGETLNEYLDYWRDQLHGAPLLLDLPADFPRAERQGVSDAVTEFTLPAQTARAVVNLAAEARATTFMVLITAFGVTTSIMARQDDLVIGTFAANRHAVELEDLIGLFVNLLPLRVTCAPTLTFAELLAQVRSTALEAFRHQELPFDHLVGALRPPRDLTRNPVVQVAFQSFGSRAGRLALPGITSTLLAEGQGGNALDLLMTIQESGDELAGELHYRADLFTTATAGEFAASYAAILAEVTSHPDRTLEELIGPRRTI
ncbi:MAG TPA: condensation domain-containing protein [Streptosporangiaceae bacterium]|nr:condensation domain-containing protein [Streptosporangiaceae bacterium]